MRQFILFTWLAALTFWAVAAHQLLYATNALAETNFNFQVQLMHLFNKGRQK